MNVTDAMIESGRKSPTDEILAELGKVRLFVDAPREKNQLITKAENLLQGVLDPATKITIPFMPEDLDKGRSQLFLAGFGVPRILLSAYVVSGREVFFNTAKEVILAWATYENKAWLPRGLLWNDHAVAERMLVLAEFWRLYRQHSNYRADEARVVLQLAARTSWLLAAPSHFRFSTNHGVMQNLALWHFSLAFPTLPNSDEYQQVALRRMRDQMSFYINEEGVVLEHSGGYHVFGIEILAYAMKYLTLSNLPIPDEWIRKYNGAQSFYSNLRLPGGSLPVFGDTGTGNNALGPLIVNVDSQGRATSLAPKKKWAPKSAYSMYPVAGYSVWWDGLDAWPNVRNLAQLVVSWSYFPGHAHKHADEMSLSLWARGQRWLTNMGARSSGSEERPEALSWDGSNAPHLVNEDYDSSRSTKLKFFGWSGRLAFLDLERTGPDGYIARRQIIWKKPNLWIVLDHIRGKEGHRSRTIWRADESVKWSNGKVPWLFHLRGKNTQFALTGLFVGSDGAEPLLRPGSESKDSQGSQSIVVEQDAGNSCAAAVWSLAQHHNASLDFMDGDRSIECERFDTWKLSFPTDSGNTTIRRSGQVVEFVFADRNGSRQSESAILQKANDNSEEYQQIRNGYAQAAAKYPVISVAYRNKAIKLLAILFLLQEVLFLLCGRIYPAACRNLRTLSAIAWIAGGTLLCTQFERVVEIFSGLNLPI